LVEGQDPPTVLRSVINHLQRRAPEGSALEVIAMNDGSPASSLAPNHPLVRAAEAVLKRETGKQAVQVRLGATVPITAIFKQDMGIDTLMFGYNFPTRMSTPRMNSTGFNPSATVRALGLSSWLSWQTTRLSPSARRQGEYCSPVGMKAVEQRRSIYNAD
jgi:hypothetical protein